MTPEQMIDQASRRCKDCHDVIPVPLSGYYASRLVYCAELADSHGKDSLVGQNLEKFWGKSLALVALMSSATTMATSTPRAHHTAHNA